MTYYINKFSKIFFLILCLIYSNNLFADSILEITDDDLIIGDKNAPITIIEYASLSCGHCADFHINTLPEIKKEFIDKGKVKFIMRDFPFNYPALLGSLALKCVPQDIRFDYANALFKLQNKWVTRENKKSTEELYKIMQSGGMTKDRFNACINDVDLENKILQGLMDAQKEFDIKSTPSFIINGTLYEGNKPFKDFKKIIDKILSK